MPKDKYETYDANDWEIRTDKMKNIVINTPRPISPLAALQLADAIVEVVRKVTPSLPDDIIFNNLHIEPET